MTLSLTLIVPTYNRPALLERCLAHFNLDECALPIVVADGSGPEARAANARVVAELGGDLTIAHVPYAPEIGFAERCALALRDVGTPLVAFHADDDFMFAADLATVAAQLEREPTLAAAQGSMLLVRRQDPLVRVMPYVYQDVLQPTPMTRLAWHMRSYRPTFYSVHRVWSARKAFEAIAPFADWWPRMIEIGLSSVIAVNGPFRHVDTLQGVRETHAASDSSTDHNWPRIVTDQRFSAVLDAYASAVAAIAAAHPEAAQEAPEIAEDRGHAVRAAFLEFVKCALVPAHKPKPQSLTRQSWAIHDLFANGRLSAGRRQALQTVFSSLT